MGQVHAVAIAEALGVERFEVNLMEQNVAERNLEPREVKTLPGA